MTKRERKLAYGGSAALGAAAALGGIRLAGGIKRASMARTLARGVGRARPRVNPRRGDMTRAFSKLQAGKLSRGRKLVNDFLVTGSRGFLELHKRGLDKL